MAVEKQLRLKVISNESLSEAERQAVISLCNRAYEQDLAPLPSTLRGAVHVLGTYGQAMVSRAMWVTRWLQVGTGPLLRTAYVETLATDSPYRMRGFASAVMRRLAREVRDFDLGALSPFQHRISRTLGLEKLARSGVHQNPRGAGADAQG